MFTNKHAPNFIRVISSCSDALLSEVCNLLAGPRVAGTTWKRVTQKPYSNYAVSNHGEVMRLDYGRNTMPGYIVPARLHYRYGYTLVDLTSGSGPTRTNWTAQVHTLVCSAFHGPRPDGMQCAHINGIRTDARPSNLRWSTATQNAADRERHGTTARGDTHGRTKISDHEVSTIRKLRADGLRVVFLARQYGVTSSHIHKIVNGTARVMPA
ncbi:MAG: HNH endonuclease signature motif containing protein [Janthinobacterium lividum]